MRTSKTPHVMYASVVYNYLVYSSMPYNACVSDQSEVYSMAKANKSTTPRRQLFLSKEKRRAALGNSAGRGSNQYNTMLRHLWQIRVKFSADVVREERGEDEATGQKSLQAEPTVTSQRSQEHGDYER